MARVESIGRQVNNIISQVNGIGISKAETRAESGILAENGHKVSNLVHSYKSLDNLRDDLTNLGKYAKAKHNIKEMREINANVVREWIQSKDITYNTASNYLSEINKVAEHLNITREEIKDLRVELKDTLRENEKTSRAYNLEKVEVAERSSIAYTMQSQYGLRSQEARHITEKQLEGNTLSFQGKGGREQSKELQPQHAQQLREHFKEHNGKYSISYTSYREDLKEAIEKTGQEFNGTHGLRHTYAQNRLEEGASKAEVSKDMGHTREEITDTYLR